MKVRDLATPRVTTVGPDTSVWHAAKIMLGHRISGLPVVDDDMKLVGIVTEGDLIHRSELGLSRIHDSGSSGARVTNARDYVKRHSWRTGDVMTQNVVTIEENDSVGKAAQLLEEHNVKRLPVVREGKLVGVISRSDLLRVVATSAPEQIASGDVAIRTSIATRLHEIFSNREKPIKITVVNGNVRLWGEVASSDERDAARVIAENTRGVKCIENHLKLPSEAITSTS